jgi:hypothetical protein
MPENGCRSVKLSVSQVVNVSSGQIAEILVLRRDGEIGSREPYRHNPHPPKR